MEKEFNDYCTNSRILYDPLRRLRRQSKTFTFSDQNRLSTEFFIDNDETDKMWESSRIERISKFERLYTKTSNSQKRNHISDAELAAILQAQQG